jgi:hypothetical protein
MTAKRSRLRAGPWPVGRTGFDYRFDVASQVMAAEAQDIHVQAIIPLSGQAGDKSASVSEGSWCTSPTGKRWLRSWIRGSRPRPLADQAFGPDLPLPRVGESIAAD